MRVMVIVKANKDSEAGILPTEEMLAAMGKYNEELVKAGVMLAGEGLLQGQARHLLRGQEIRQRWPLRRDQGAHRRLLAVAGEEHGGGRRVAEARPLDGGAEVEIRPVYEAEDFGEEFTPELRAQEERLRAEVERLRTS
jgi:hypothetical protein